MKSHPSHYHSFHSNHVTFSRWWSRRHGFQEGDVVIGGMIWLAWFLRSDRVFYLTSLANTMVSTLVFHLSSVSLTPLGYRSWLNIRVVSFLPILQTFERRYQPARLRPRRLKIAESKANVCRWLESRQFGWQIFLDKAVSLLPYTFLRTGANPSSSSSEPRATDGRPCIGNGA